MSAAAFPPTAPAGTLDRIRAIAADLTGLSPRAICPSAHLCNDLGFDSLDAVEFVAAMEDEFGFEGPAAGPAAEADAAEVRTIADAVTWVEQRCATHARPHPERASS